MRNVMHVGWFACFLLYKTIWKNQHNTSNITVTGDLEYISDKGSQSMKTVQCHFLLQVTTWRRHFCCVTTEWSTRCERGDLLLRARGARTYQYAYKVYAEWVRSLGNVDFINTWRCGPPFVILLLGQDASCPHNAKPCVTVPSQSFASYLSQEWISFLYSSFWYIKAFLNSLSESSVDVLKWPISHALAIYQLP